LPDDWIGIVLYSITIVALPVHRSDFLYSRTGRNNNYLPCTVLLHFSSDLNRKSVRYACLQSAFNK
jgi:hypothetical protein